jgi:hypothetical protein
MALVPVIAAGWFAYDHRSALLARVSVDGVAAAVARVDPPAQAVVAPAGQPSGAEARIVRISSRPGLDVPASVVTKWWLDDARFSRVTVYVPVGTTPREALRIALAERGYQALP